MKTIPKHHLYRQRNQPVGADSISAHNAKLEAHRLMMGDVLKGAGSFRSKAVGVYKGKEVVHVAPPAHNISGLMAELFDWAKQSDAHPLIVSSVFTMSLNLFIRLSMATGAWAGFGKP